MNKVILSLLLVTAMIVSNHASLPSAGESAPPVGALGEAIKHPNGEAIMPPNGAAIMPPNGEGIMPPPGEVPPPGK